MDGYLGGLPPAAAGALVAGSWFRWHHKPDWKLAALGSLGGGIWWLIRPAEAITGTALAAGVLLWKVVEQRRRNLAALPRLFVVPVLCVLVLPVTITLLHNRAVTGDPFVLPYVHAQRMLGVPQSFVFQSPVPPPPTGAFVHRTMYEGQLKAKRHFNTVAGFIAWTASKIHLTFSYFSGFVLAVLLGIIAYSAGLSQLSRYCLGLFAATCAFEFLYVFWSSHYIGGSLILLVVPYTEAFMKLGPLLERKKVIPPSWTPALAGIVFILACVGPSGFQRDRFIEDARILSFRDRFQRTLESTPGKHLVVMDDRKFLDRHIQWIYNRANIDHAKVVWARSLNSEKDGRLLAYFSERTLWTVTFDNETPRLVPLRSPREIRR